MTNSEIEARPAAVQYESFGADEKKQETEHVDHVRVEHETNVVVDTGIKFRQIQENAIEADMFEHGLTLWQLIRLYRKSIFWAFIAGCSIIMEGYDLSVTGAYTALPVFRRYFGTYYPDIDQWQIPSQWQTALSQAGLIGNFIGIPFGAFLIERYGYRYALMGNYILVIPFIAIQAFATSLRMLFAGSLLTGIPFGVFSTLACGYASEVTPVKLRPYLTGWINYCWVIGLLFGTGIANAILVYTKIIGFRIGYMTQWTWPPILFIAMYFAPDAPWWLVRKNRLEDAEKSMRRLTDPSIHEHVPALVQGMVRTYQLEVDVTSGSNWIDCFRGPDRRRTEIACMAFACQSLCGDPFCGNVIYFLESSGMATTFAFKMGLINWVVIFFGCCLCYVAMAFFGRRTLYCVGMGTMCAGLILIGGLQKAADHVNPDALKGMAGVVIMWNVWRVVTIGPACYTVVSEASSSRLRNKTIALARISYQLVGLIVNFFEPWLINPASLDLKGYTAWVWAPICFVGFVWCFFRLPEFKNRSYFELDVLFERRIGSRKFAQTPVDGLADDKLREERHISQHQ